jgi:hypothetical protein
MGMTKVILGAIVAVLIALLGGWIWGASAKSTADRAVQSAELRIDLLEARSAVLGARLDLYSVNFGEASRHLEEAKALVQRAAQRLQSRGGADDRKRLDAASASIDEAQRLAGKLDQTANARAADAAKALDAALESAKR